MSGDDVTETRQETAAEYLRAAAESLRAATAGTTPLRWAASRGSVVSGEDGWVICCASREDAAYIAMMQPGVGWVIADWLDEDARFYEMDAVDDEGSYGTRSLSVAAVVLGRSWPS